MVWKNSLLTGGWKADILSLRVSKISLECLGITWIFFLAISVLALMLNFFETHQNVLKVNYRLCCTFSRDISAVSFIFKMSKNWLTSTLWRQSNKIFKLISSILKTNFLSSHLISQRFNSSNQFFHLIADQNVWYLINYTL